MTIFDTAIDTLFTDSNLAVDGIYTPSGGDPVAVRVVMEAVEEPTDVFSSGAVVTKQKADIRVSDVALPVEGDALVLDVGSFTITNAQRRDADQIVWSMELLE